MTENPLVAIATKIRNATGSQNKFTVAEINLLTVVNKYYPNFDANPKWFINGQAQTGTDEKPVNGGTINCLFDSYHVDSPNLLRKLVGSKAHLDIHFPVARYTDTDFSIKAVAQTIKLVKEDGSNLIDPISIADGDTNYGFLGYSLSVPLTNEIAEYLISGKAINATYTGIGTHDGATIPGPVSIQLQTF